MDEKQIWKLIRRANRGDRDAWEALLEANMGCIKQAAKRISRRRRIPLDEVLSFAHEAFVRSVQLYRPKRGAKFITYLWHAIDRKLLACQRQTTIRTPLNSCRTFPENYRIANSTGSIYRGDAGRVAAAIDGNFDDPESVADKNLQRERLYSLIERLPARERFIIKARIIHNLHLAQIGRSIGRSTESVRKTEMSAHNRLRKFLEEEQEGRSAEMEESARASA